MRESLFISIIIPAYNVESTIGTLMVQLTILKRLFRGFQKNMTTLLVFLKLTWVLVVLGILG